MGGVGAGGPSPSGQHDPRLPVIHVRGFAILGGQSAGDSPLQGRRSLQQASTFACGQPRTQHGRVAALRIARLGLSRVH